MFFFFFYPTQNYLKKSNSLCQFLNVICNVYEQQISINIKLCPQRLSLGDSVVSVSQVSRGGLKAGPFRSALQVLITRVSGGAKPESVSGMGYFTVSVELFSSVRCVAFRDPPPFLLLKKPWKPQIWWSVLVLQLRKPPKYKVIPQNTRVKIHNIFNVFLPLNFADIHPVVRCVAISLLLSLKSRDYLFTRWFQWFVT